MPASKRFLLAADLRGLRESETFFRLCSNSLILIRVHLRKSAAAHCLLLTAHCSLTSRFAAAFR
jgi:hypothetical protein